MGGVRVSFCVIQCRYIFFIVSVMSSMTLISFSDRCNVCIAIGFSGVMFFLPYSLYFSQIVFTTGP